MLNALINFLLNRKGHPEQKDSSMANQAPYKVEPPVVTPIAVPPESGKSVETTSWPFPTPVGTAEETPVKPAVKAKSARTKKAPAAAMTAAKPKKAPAKPRAKKTQK